MNDLLDPVMEELAARAVRAAHCEVALRKAPDLVEHIRGLAESADRLERGEILAEESTPLVTETVDDADEIFVRLLEWVTFWAETLGVSKPSPAVVWARVDDDSPAASPWSEVLGFRAGTTPAGAALLTRLLTVWLSGRSEQIVEFEVADEFHRDVADMVFRKRARYRLTPVRERLVRSRACPSCGEDTVGAVWGSGDVLHVVVSCERCLAVVEVPRASDLVRWLGVDVRRPVLSEACDAFEHGSCAGVNCGCFCHFDGVVEVGRGAATPMGPLRPRPSLPPSVQGVDPRVCSRCCQIHPVGACDEAGEVVPGDD